jgi:hypothetical protein
MKESNVILPEMLFVRGGTARLNQFYGFEEVEDDEILTFTEDRYVAIDRTTVEVFANFLTFLRLSRPGYKDTGPLGGIDKYITDFDILTPYEEGIHTVTSQTLSYRADCAHNPIAHVSPYGMNELGRWMDRVLGISNDEDHQIQAPPDSMFLTYVLLGGDQNDHSWWEEAVLTTTDLEKRVGDWNILGVTGLYNMGYEITSQQYFPEPTEQRILDSASFHNAITVGLKDDGLYYQGINNTR